MQRRDKAGGKLTKTQRRIALKRRNTPKVGRTPPTADANQRIELLERRLNEALEQQAATSEVLKVISSSPGELNPVFSAMLENAVRICEAKFGTMYRYDDGLFHIEAMLGTPPALADFFRQRGSFVPERNAPLDRLLQTKMVIHTVDQAAEQNQPPSAKLGGARSHIAVPMLKQNKLVGAIVIYRQEVRPFTDKQIELVQNFAAQAVIAIENARLLNELRRRTDDLSEALEQQTATSQVLQVISSSPGELEPVFQVMLEKAVRICDANFGNLYLREGDAFRIGATYGASPAYVEFVRTEQVFQLNPKVGLGRLVRTKELYHLADISAVPTHGDKLREATIKLAGARTLIALPMLKDNEVIGAIVIYRQEVRPFTDKQIELVKNFAAQAVIAIENTRLLNELRESLQQQMATADVLKVISRSTFDLQVVLDTLVQSAARLCEADMASVTRPKGTNAAHYHVAYFGFSPEWFELMQTNPLQPGRETLIGRTLLEGRTVHIPDVLADPEYSAPKAQQLGAFRAALGVPMLRDGIAIGVFMIARRTPRPFTDKQIELATTFADQAVIAIENVRLFDEVQGRTRDLSEALEQQTATADVLKVISNSPGELEPVFDAMLENATRICEAKYGVMFLFENNALRARAWCGVPLALAEERQRNPVIHPSPKTGVGRVLRTKQTAHIVDVLAEPEYTNVPAGFTKPGIVQFGGARTELAVPMLKDDELVGTIVIYRTEVRPFTDKQIDLVTNFAAQAVIAIENTRLLKELRHRTDDLSEALEQQTATSEVLQVISSSQGQLQPVFDSLLANATRLCVAKFGTLFLCEGKNFRVVAQHNSPSELAELRRRNPVGRGGPAVRRSRQTKRVVQVADIAADPAYLERDPDRVALVELGGYRAILSVPMLKDDEVIGAINIYRQEAGPFLDKQVDLVKNFAAQAVIAIENTRLLNELREFLQQQTATADVLKVISRSTFDLQTVLQTLVELAARLCEAEKGTITRKQGESFYRSESYGFSSEFMNYVRNIPVKPERGTAAGRALLERKAVHIPDVQTDPEYDFEGRRFDAYRTILGVPMLREGDPIGVLTLTRSEVRPFAEKQIELVATFADQAAIAIENVRLFESVEARTRELGTSLENLRATQDRLVQTQKLASLGQLTAGIAHEIKNPLNFVNNFSGVSVELIDELRQVLSGAHLDSKLRAEIGEIADTLQGNLDKVVQHGKRADAIVKNMLLHSREGSGEHRLIDINALVEESLNLAYHGVRAEKQGFNITLERSLDPNAGEADVFPQDITRVLLNLISNGFYAATRRTAEGNGGDYEPTLAAVTKSLGDRVEIRIRDNGTGIPPEVKEKMFNPFFTTKPAGEGTGLGLSISHDIIVKQHGGSIEVDTQLGEFTEIRVILPRIAVFL